MRDKVKENGSVALLVNKFVICSPSIDKKSSLLTDLLELMILPAPRASASFGYPLSYLKR